MGSTRKLFHPQKPCPQNHLRRFFIKNFKKLKEKAIKNKNYLKNQIIMKSKYIKKQKFSIVGDKIKDISEVFQQNLLRNVELNVPFREQYMTSEQLKDIYPLSRINIEKITKSLGLNDDEAEIKLNSSTNKNVICPINRKKSKLKIFLLQFLNTFRLLLLIATLCCLLIFILDNNHKKELIMSIILFIVLTILCISSYLEEMKILKQITGFQSVIPYDCNVIRSGRKNKINVEDIIVGDLIWIKTGDRIPADMRLIYTEDLKIETSWLSGEVEPLSYTSEPATEDKGVFESQNIVFNGCSVTSGKGLGLVIRIGNETVLGKLVDITSKEKTNKSRLEIEHHRFVLFITVSAFIVSALTFVLGILLNGFDNIINTFVNGFLIILVACVPQGLPVTLTAQLLIVARRLSKCGLYLKRLDLADTLGLTSILMVDKTTVLTENQLKLSDLWTYKNSYTGSELLNEYNKNSLSVSTSQSTSSKSKLSDLTYNIIPGIDDIYGVMITIMSICNKSHIQSSMHSSSLLRKTPSFRRKNMIHTLNPEELTITTLNNKESNSTSLKPQFSLKHKDLCQKSVIGKNIDVALVKYAEQMISVEKIRNDFEIVFEIPFSSQRRFHLIIVCDKSSRNSSSFNSDNDEIIRYTLMVKGAPEELILNCTTIASPNGEEKLDDDKMIEFEKAFLRYCNEGKSCIGYAMYEFEDYADVQFYMDSADSNFPDDCWCFVGMTTLYDPVIPNVSNAIKEAEKANIRLYMVTGDHPITAESIARQMDFDFGDQRVADSDMSTASIRSTNIDTNSDIINKDNLDEINLEDNKSHLSLSSIRIDPLSNLEVIRGDTVQELNKTDWSRLLNKKRIVFARTTPIQKMKIVRNCQLSGEIVTVTGDGVMDAPALKQADVGLAMDAVGSIFAKEAADIVVVKPQLNNLIRSISQGRLLYENLKKTIAYTLSHLTAEMFPVWFSFILGFPLGMNSLQILAIDLLSEIPPSVALVFEPAEKDLMNRPPRKQRNWLISKSLLLYSYIFAGLTIGIGCILSYFTVFWSHGIDIKDILNTDEIYWKSNSPDLITSTGLNITSIQQVEYYYEASAAWHITLVLSQSLHVWNCTTRRISLFKHGIKNYILVISVIFEIFTLFFVIYTPGVQEIFEVKPPNWFIWLYPIAVGIILLVFNETRKYFIRKYSNKHNNNKLISIFKW